MQLSSWVTVLLLKSWLELRECVVTSVAHDRRSTHRISTRSVRKALSIADCELKTIPQPVTKPQASVHCDKSGMADLSQTNIRCTTSVTIPGANLLWSHASTKSVKSISSSLAKIDGKSSFCMTSPTSPTCRQSLSRKSTFKCGFTKMPASGAYISQDEGAAFVG